MCPQISSHLELVLSYVFVMASSQFLQNQHTCVYFNSYLGLTAKLIQFRRPRASGTGPNKDKTFSFLLKENTHAQIGAVGEHIRYGHSCFSDY